MSTTFVIVSLAMDDGREVGDGCRELDLVVETAVASACRRGGACRVARHEENLLQGSAEEGK